MIERSLRALYALPGPGQFQVQYVHCIRIPNCGPFERETVVHNFLFRLPRASSWPAMTQARLFPKQRLD
ncbi:hypothetical protein MPLDJ20_240065 [Mesorhizobium plurifarium]|uniref:Uncharacterized protein n=1 Tax=Mesorhizobium plurifarium TaxID=69974 RepID=A0A090F513_MESPL|nr:hypothetical protein MPLDJ20_240065 [Mesorhizobium plurifarium]